ncbi:MAG TPA: hypothetical protein VH619_18885 [Verrucomicrobiae bacterium]|jgi:hypothetical protein|nr:hypothetical protein [Verrucomicrobiae bacterium]
MKHAKRVQKESSSNTVKKESQNSPGQVIKGALAVVKSEIEALMEPPEDVLGVRFKPFGPLEPPDTVVYARYLVWDVYQKALSARYDDGGNLCSLIECVKFHPGLKPELDALRALFSGMVTISKLECTDSDGMLDGRRLTEVEQRLTMELRRLDKPSGIPTDAVLNLLYAGSYEDLLKDVPSASETADAVGEIMRAQRVMNLLTIWRNAQ